MWQRKLEPDLLALSKQAVKRLATLQNIASDVELHDTQMETELAQACIEITKTADDMRAVITEYEKELLNKVNEARDTLPEARQQKPNETATY